MKSKKYPLKTELLSWNILIIFIMANYFPLKAQIPPTIFKLISINNQIKVLHNTKYDPYPDFYIPASGLFSYPQTVYEPNSYELIFEDNFDNFNIDKDKWNQIDDILLHSRLWSGKGLKRPGGIDYVAFENNYGFTGSTIKLIAKELASPLELKCIDYELENTLLQDGKPNKRIHKYSSGILESKRLYKYGYFEAKIKLPIIENVWPAFWFFKGTSEIDVFEILRGGDAEPGISIAEASSTVWMTYHYWWNNNQSNSEHITSKIKNFTPPFPFTSGNFYPISNQWHTWGFLWDEFRMNWYLDGNLIHSVYHYIYQPTMNIKIPLTTNQQLQAILISNPSKLVVNSGYPNEQVQMILNLTVTNFSQSANSDYAYTVGSLPKEMEIDYVRIYAIRNCTSNLNFCDNDNLPSEIMGKNITIGSNNYNLFPCNQVVKNLGGCFGTNPPCSIVRTDHMQQVRVVASENIFLKPGFKVDEGAYFYGFIEDCNTVNLRISSDSLPMPLKELNVIKNKEDSAFFSQINISDEFRLYERELSFNVYPNPSEGKFFIETYFDIITKLHINIIDVTGVNIYSSDVYKEKGIIEIDITRQSKGIYFIIISNSYSQVIEKVILH